MLLGCEFFVIFPGDGCAFDDIALVVLVRSIDGLIHGLACSLIAPFSPLLRSSDGLIGGSLTRTRFIIHVQFIIHAQCCLKAVAVTIAEKHLVV